MIIDMEKPSILLTASYSAEIISPAWTEKIIPFRKKTVYRLIAFNVKTRFFFLSVTPNSLSIFFGHIANEEQMTFHSFASSLTNLKIASINSLTVRITLAVFVLVFLPLVNEQCYGRFYKAICLGSVCKMAN